MHRWRLTTGLILGWTFLLACMFASLSIATNLRFIDLIFLGILFAPVWLAGLMPLMFLRVLANLRRAIRSSQRASVLTQPDIPRDPPKPPESLGLALFGAAVCLTSTTR